VCALLNSDIAGNIGWP